MISHRDLGWAAGFLDGEGTFGSDRGKNSASGNVAASQVQLWPLLKLQKLFGGTHYLVHRLNKNDYHRWRVGGPRAIGVMMTLFPLLSPRRKGQIMLFLAKWASRPPQRQYRTKCLSGHLYLAGSEYANKNGHRVCRICAKESSRRNNKTPERRQYMREYKHAMKVREA